MKLSTAHKIGRFFQYFVLILVGVIMIYPLVWMVGATFKSNAEIFAGIGFLTANPTLQGYIDAVTQNYGGDISIWRAFINTYSFVIPKVIFTVISSVIAAYGFSRFKFKGRDMLFGIMISTLFLPQVVLNVPQYLMYNSFGWINSPFYLPLWVPTLFATETYFVYQLVQFMRSIPHDLDEAAAIDGCGPVKILYKIIAPMLSPSLVACGLFQFMWSCNDYMGPLLYVQTPSKYPMSIFVKLSMDADSGFNWNRILALSLISIIPQLVVFFCAQDAFIDGISAGAVKGETPLWQSKIYCSTRLPRTTGMGYGAAFILKTGLPCPGGRRGCIIESLPRRGRWPRRRPRPDEARLYRYYPCTGCGCKVCPHQSAARTASPDGEA